MEEEAVSQNDPNGPAGQALIHIQLENTPIHTYLQSSCVDMNGKPADRGTVSTSDINDNTMVSDLSPESLTRASRTPRKAATFGKRSNSMRRNPKAEVAKQGWLYKQASSGVKQWNKRWFVLTDRCLFYYKDEKEDTVLGSLPLLSFRISELQPSDNINRRHAFKVCSELESEDVWSSSAAVLCVQAEHAGTRTYFFSSDSRQEQQDWLSAMSRAALVQEPAHRTNSETTLTAELNTTMVTIGTDTHTHTPPDAHTQQPCSQGNGQRSDVHDAPANPEVTNGVDAMMDTPPSSAPHSEQDVRVGGERGGPASDHAPHPALHPQPNGWGSYGPPPDGHHYGNGPPTPGPHHGEGRPPPQGPRGGGEENAVLRRGFVPRTAPERMAQRKSSMTQLQQWVNQRRGVASIEDMNSPARYYTVNRGVPVPADYYGVYGGGGAPYPDEYPPLYPPGVRPDSVCSGYDRQPPRWAPHPEQRRSLRDGPPVYGGVGVGAPPPQRDPWAPPGYYGNAAVDGVQASVRRMSIQPRSRSVPRSPSSSSGGGPYSPSPRGFAASPMRSPSARFDRAPPPGRTREDAIYDDPALYGVRRSMSSPKYEYPGDRRSLSQGMYHYNNYPASPSLHSKMDDILDLQLQRNLEYLDQQVNSQDRLIGMVTRMVDRSSPRAKLFAQVPPFHDMYRDLHPTLKFNEIETSKLLGRLCEQNRLLKDQEAVVHRLRMDKDSLEGALVATHQEMEAYRAQPLALDKLQLKKETLQNQLINIRGELSQASSALTTTRMEAEALEDEASAIHGDLWEQLNAGGQSELVHRHIQKEFWRVQDVLEGLHKSNLSRGTDTAKHRGVSGVTGSFSTSSPASPLSSVSVTSPLSPFSPVPGSQVSPSRHPGPEEIGPPRPPLPKSYYPMESPSSPAPSLPPLPLDSAAWLRSVGLDDGYRDDHESRSTKHKFGYRQDQMPMERTNSSDVQELDQDRQSNMNKVGIVPPRSKSPAADHDMAVFRRNGKVPNGISRERPKSAVFPAEVKSKMSVEEQNERLRRNQSSSVRDKRRSLNLSTGQTTSNYRVVRRRQTAHEVDIKDLEAAVRGEGVESPREEIARLRRSQIEPDHYSLDINKSAAPNKALIPERYLDVEDDAPLSPEEQKEKQKKVERIKTLIAKSNLQNVVPLLDGPAEGRSQANPDQQLHEQEKRIEMSCALAAEASRRSRLLSAQCAPSPPASPTSLAPPPSSADFSDSAHNVKV